MDVLIYSALNEQAALKKDIAEKQKCLFDLKLNAKDPASGGGDTAADVFVSVLYFLNNIIATFPNSPSILNISLISSILSSIHVWNAS